MNISIEDFKNDSFIISIYDVSGKLVKTKILDNIDSSINISELKSGLYIYKLVDKEDILKIDKLVIE